jgi:hypothetical protein
VSRGDARLATSGVECAPAPLVIRYESTQQMVGGASMTRSIPRKTWSELSGGQRTAVLVLGSLQLSLAATAWTDLARRPAGQVNGRKALWALIIAINWIGPLSYFRWGRRG